jgi:hypothetical protein
VNGEPGLRHIPGVTVQMDGKDLYTRDLILGVEFENLSCEQAVSSSCQHAGGHLPVPADHTVMTKNRKAFITAVLCFKQHNLTISRSANAAEK